MRWSKGEALLEVGAEIALPTMCPLTMFMEYLKGEEESAAMRKEAGLCETKKNARYKARERNGTRALGKHVQLREDGPVRGRISRLLSDSVAQLLGHRQRNLHLHKLHRRVVEIPRRDKNRCAGNEQCHRNHRQAEPTNHGAG